MVSFNFSHQNFDREADSCIIFQEILSEFQPKFRFCTKEFSHDLNFINICITEFTSLAMDFALNDTSSLRLELQDCGGLESYLMLRIHHGIDEHRRRHGNDKTFKIVSR